jgi:Fic family protein
VLIGISSNLSIAPVRIGGNSINTADFIPPRHDFVNKLMGDLENFLHSQHPVPEIIKIAIIHYQFETIHPFWQFVPHL